MGKAEFLSRDVLFRRVDTLTYQGEHRARIAFPLGGIGAGCISLSGRGSLIDWEIFNRPNKGMAVPYAFFAIWARAEGQAPVTRVLQAPPEPPFDGSGWGQYSGIGFGVNREDGSGLPHMRSCAFRGEFPLAWVQFEEPRLPVEVELHAYSPFIPCNADDSSLPIAVLYYRVHNPGQQPVEVSIAGNMANPLGYDHGGSLSGRSRPGLGQNLNRCVQEPGLTALSLTTERYPETHPRYGTLALATAAPGAWCQAAWLRGAWYDMFHDYWDHFSRDGKLAPREYPPSAEGSTDVGTLGIGSTIAPGETATFPFVIAWHLPNYVKYWGEAATLEEQEAPTWRNYYATLWPDALAVVRYYMAHEARLYDETRRFHDTLFASTLPEAVLDAASSQASTLHSPTVLRLTDGTFYGFEGCHGNAGCCEGTCTHVWNYAQTQAFLFPALERSQRRADYAYNMNPDGSMGFRLQLPLGSPPWTFHPAADGQMGGLLKLYRDWKLSGDDAYLRELWPSAQKALEYAWLQWDPDGDGLMTGMQHNTYDIEFWGPDGMCTSFYLAALQAAVSMAEAVGDDPMPYRDLLAKGRAAMESELWDGEYFIQRIQWQGLRAPDPTEAGTYHTRYSPEARELLEAEGPKYQYGPGCLSDGVLGAWLGECSGVAPVLDPAKVTSHLLAVHRYNFRHDLSDYPNPQRPTYALGHEAGLLLCTWPKGGALTLPMVYSNEVWTGIEYQVASHLMMNGRIDEGLEIVRAVRDRYDGRVRNPFDEYECGHWYARAMASYALLQGMSGARYDAVDKVLYLKPSVRGDFRAFLSTATGYGTVGVRDGQPFLDVKAGTIDCRRIEYEPRG